jgi:hypothetical protein
VPVPFADFFIGSFQVAPTSVLVKQADFAHELALVNVPLERLPYNGREENLPVTLKWGYSPGTTIRTFYGYVHHTEPYYTEALTNSVRLVCLGATSVLSQPIQRSWSGRTVDSVAREIVEKALLSFFGQPTTTVFDSLPAQGCTAWQYLIELAKTAGYRLAGRGTEVRFMSSDVLIGFAKGTAPILSFRVDFDEFQPKVGGGTGGSTRRVAFGMDPRMGQLFNVTDTGTAPLLGTESPRPAATEVVPILADSPGAAAAQLAGQAATSGFSYGATAALKQGDAGITNGSVVFINGVEASQNGHWYVEEVEHEIDVRASDYRAYLTLGRDALGAQAPNLLGGIVSPVLRQTPLGDLSMAAPPSVLVNGLWRSGWARRAS